MNIPNLNSINLFFMSPYMPSFAMIVAESSICDFDYQRNNQPPILRINTDCAYLWSSETTQSSRQLPMYLCSRTTSSGPAAGFSWFRSSITWLLYTYPDLAPLQSLHQDECTAPFGPSRPVHKSGSSHWESYPAQSFQYNDFPYHRETRSWISDSVVSTT